VEYLPLRDLKDQGDANFVSEFLSTIAPKAAGNDQILSVKLDPAIWANVIGGDDSDLSELERADNMETRAKEQDASEEESMDDIFVAENDVEALRAKESDSRERRSAFLILRCLQGENLL
jgi:hypothetical protein